MLVVKNKYFEKRGSIYTIYEDKDLAIDFVQDKVSKSYQGVIRGFHGDASTYKLISCLHGKIKLVTYDIYSDEKQSYILDGDDKNFTSILVPPNVLNAHQCLSSFCIFHYKWSEYYTTPEKQWSVRYDDSDINADWNNEFCDIISERDMNSGSLKELKECLKKT